MNECQDLEPLFTSYVDGETVPAERARVDEHLDRCPPCRARVAVERTVRQVLQARRPRLGPCASDALRARCAAQRANAGMAGAARLAAARRWVPMSLAATLLLAVASVFLFANQSVSALATQLTVDHLKCFRLGSGGDVGDADAVGASWAKTYGWPLVVPAASRANDLELVCVRRCLVTEGRAAHIMYKWRGEPLSVFVLPRQVGHNPGVTEIVHRFGHEAVTWSAGNRQYVVVTHGRPPDLDAVVRYVKANAR